MESWRNCWRKGIVPILGSNHLLPLKEALENNDVRLVQHTTTEPPPLQCVQDWSVTAACALGFCGWQGDNLDTVAEVEEFFARCCFAIDQNLNEPAGCRWFLNWFDDNPREVVFKELLEEVNLALQQREDHVRS